MPAQILRHKDTDGSPLLEKIRDAAGQKGTGKWTAIESLEQGMPVTLIGEAVFARCLSALQDQRIAASTRLAGPNGAKFTGDRAAFLDSIRQALFASKVVSYAQGFMLMAEAAKQYGWKLNYGEISLMWRGGCIIRSVFLAKIKEAYDTDPQLPNLLLAPYFTEALAKCQDGWRQARCRRRYPASESQRVLSMTRPSLSTWQVVAQSAMLGVPIPALSTALAFYDGYRCARGPANLLQVRGARYARPPEVSARAPTGPVAGAARLLRRAHVRAPGEAWQVGARQLDWHHRPRHRGDLRRMSSRSRELTRARQCAVIVR